MQFTHCVAPADRGTPWRLAPETRCGPASGSGTSSAPRCACARAPSGASACGPSERGTAAIAPCLLLAGLVQLAAQGRCAALRRLELNRFGVCARHRPCVSTHASAAHQPRRRRARAAPRLTGSAGERAGGLGRARADAKAAEHQAAQGHAAALRAELKTAGKQCMLTHGRAHESVPFGHRLASTSRHLNMASAGHAQRDPRTCAARCSGQTRGPARPCS